MAAPDVELADAIVTDIEDVARNWSQSFDAERTWVPLWIGEDELGSLQCLVNPWPIIEVVAEGRKSTYSQISMDIGFAKRLQDRTRAEIDDLRELVESVYKRYVKTDFIVANVGKFVALRRLDEYFAFDPTRLNRDSATGKYTGDFLSYFRVPYRFIEDV